MYIAVAGNIGSGKTTMTELIAERCNARTYFEESDNPYIGDFYEDMNRWAFHLQIYFLGSRIRHAKQILINDGMLIQDRTLYEDAYVFADNLHEMGLMNSRDFNTYMGIFEIAKDLIPRPDLLIYLKASVPTLVKQIRSRGREYEMNIMEDYLARLNGKYNNWIEENYDGEVMVVDVDNVNILEDAACMDKIITRIEEIRRSKKEK